MRHDRLWIPHFAACAAIYSDPSLRVRPVLAHQGGRIVAVSPLAEQGGAQTGWTLHRAQAQLPDAVFWPVHGPTLTGVWGEVIASVLDLTPCLESQRPGLLLADVRPAQMTALPPKSPRLRQHRARCGKCASAIAPPSYDECPSAFWLLLVRAPTPCNGWAGSAGSGSATSPA